MPRYLGYISRIPRYMWIPGYSIFKGTQVHLGNLVTMRYSAVPVHIDGVIRYPGCPGTQIPEGVPGTGTGTWELPRLGEHRETFRTEYAEVV